jgi:MFS family permease
LSVWRQLGANRTLLALSFARMGDGLGNSILFVVIPLYIARLSAPLFQVPETVRAGLLVSLFGLVFGLSQPFTGALVDRLNRRKPFVIAGLLLLAGATASYTLTDLYVYTLVLRGLQGLGLALTLPATMAILANTTERASRGGAMGIFSTLRVTSLAIGPLMGGYVYDHYGFNATFLTGAAFVLAGALFVQLWVKEVRLPASGPDRAPVRVFDRDIMSAPMLSLGLGTFVMASSIAMIVPLEQVFNERLDQSATTFGIAFSALLVSRIAVQIPLGHLSDRRGRKRLIVAGLCLLAAALVPMGLVTSTWQLVALRVLQGVATGAVAAPTFALAGDLASPGGEARQMGVVTMGFGLGIAAGTLAAGVLAVVSLPLPFWVAGAASAVAAWVIHRNVLEPSSADPPAHAWPARRAANTS